MGDDIAAIEDWASIFLHPAQLSATVAAHLALHRKEFKADVARVKTDFSSELWFTAGVDIADLMVVAVGPPKPHYPVL